MSSKGRPIIIATRGSALALAQANIIKARCMALFPDQTFEFAVIKTTGDKLQTASLQQEGHALPKGLFTKELEVALLEKQADLAVHSLKDLPTEMPDGLSLRAVGERADVRDVLIYKDGPTREPLTLQTMSKSAIVATSSTRRKVQLLDANPGLQVVDIRGNVGTRLEKVARQETPTATILALAGLLRLGITMSSDGLMRGPGVPPGLKGLILDLQTMLPCVGQGAIGVQTRSEDKIAEEICAGLNHLETYSCVTAERAFLAAMGGGCQSPIAAYAQLRDSALSMQALYHTNDRIYRATGTAPMNEGIAMGQKLSRQIREQKPAGGDMR